MDKPIDKSVKKTKRLNIIMPYFLYEDLRKIAIEQGFRIKKGPQKGNPHITRAIQFITEQHLEKEYF